MIYFVQSGEKGPIKIGKANDPYKRLISLQTSSSETLTILGLMDGDIKEGKDIHAKFYDCKIKGEWFKPSKDLIEFIENNTQKSKIEIEEDFINMFGEMLYGLQLVIDYETNISLLEMFKNYLLTDCVNYIDDRIKDIQNIVSKGGH